MRSRHIDSVDSLRVLFVGDSVLNGGALTDHEDLATTIIERNLTDSLGVPVRTLNVSAGSWGPDNAAAYLREHGHFGASILVMVWSSHDLTDTMDDFPKVGIQREMPDRRPLTATGELVSRYLWPRAKKAFAYSGRINPGFDDLIDYAEAYGLQTIFYLHAEQAEVRRGMYTKKGEIIDSLVTSRGVPIIHHVTDPDTDYRDFIHLNRSGQARIAEVLTRQLLDDAQFFMPSNSSSPHPPHKKED